MTQPRILMVLVMWLAAIGWFFSKMGVIHFDAFTFMAWRFGLGALIILVVLRPNQILKADVIAGMWLGLVFFIAMVAWILAVKQSTFGDIGLGGFIITLGVIISPYFGRLLYGEPLMQHYHWPALLAVVGSFLMAPGFETPSLGLFAIAAVLLGLYMTQMTRVSRNHNPWVMTLACFAVVTVGMAALSLMFENPSLSGFENGWMWLALSAVIATAFRFVLQAKVQGELSQSEASLIMNLEGVAVALIATAITGSLYQPLQLLGAALIVASLMTRLRLKRRATP